MSRPPTDVRDRLFIGGRWIPSSGSETIDVIDSTTEQIIGSVPEGTREDIDAAVAAASPGLSGVVGHAGGQTHGPPVRRQRGVDGTYGVTGRPHHP